MSVDGQARSLPGRESHCRIFVDQCSHKRSADVIAKEPSATKRWMCMLKVVAGVKFELAIKMPRGYILLIEYSGEGQKRRRGRRRYMLVILI